MTVRTQPPVAPDVSINSTSQNSLDAGVDPFAEGPVAEDPRPSNANSLSPAAGTGTTGYQVLAINDLGMHCGDLDTRVSSILPPFQVLLSQVIRKGSEPAILGPTEAQVFYSAASNPNDPILSKSVDPQTGYPFTGLTANDDVFKTNFWDVAFQAYDPFYPPGVLETLYDANNAANNVDIGLPVPNVEHLYIGTDGVVGNGDEGLSAVMHAMPGIANPYVANDRQRAEEHYGDKPFFINFPFGYVANDVNWFEGAGVPFAAFDDFGRENPYPLVRVQARTGVTDTNPGTVVATVDTVLPISGEASCKNCHGAPVDVPDALHPGAANRALSDAGLPVEDSVDDPLVGTSVPTSVSVEYATDINVLRLHDLKHGAAYRDTDGAGRRLRQEQHQRRPHPTATPTASPTRPWTRASRSSVRSATTPRRSIWPSSARWAATPPTPMPPPTGGCSASTRATPASCMRHTPSRPRSSRPCPRPPPTTPSPGCPATRPPARQCSSRPATSVTPAPTPSACAGPWPTAAWSARTATAIWPRSATTSPPMSARPQPFPAGADLTKRVPWANEPGCGSCHTGDAVSNMASATGATKNGYDTNGNADGIRLIRAYLDIDANAKPIVPTNKRFAENTVPAELQRLRQSRGWQPEALSGQHRSRRGHVRGLPWGHPCGVGRGRLAVAERQRHRQPAPGSLRHCHGVQHLPRHQRHAQ